MSHSGIPGINGLSFLVRPGKMNEKLKTRFSIELNRRISKIALEQVLKVFLSPSLCLKSITGFTTRQNHQTNPVIGEDLSARSYQSLCCSLVYCMRSITCPIEVQGSQRCTDAHADKNVRKSHLRLSSLIILSCAGITIIIWMADNVQQR